MTPDRVREIRIALGLSQNRLAEVLRLGPNGARNIRRWESGQCPISGPASLALDLLKEKHDLGFAEDD
jgi:DNA-binding transcriptional regulator YiaG